MLASLRLVARVAAPVAPVLDYAASRLSGKGRGEAALRLATFRHGSRTPETFAAALGTRLLHDRLTAQTERVHQYVDDDLRQGLSVSEAGQRCCALASPELYNVLTVEFGWTADQHRKWLTDPLVTELLGPYPARPAASAASQRRRGVPETSR